MLGAVYLAGALGGCSFSERLPGLFDSGPVGSAQLSKSEAGKRDAHASAGADSDLDALVSQSKAERRRSGEFDADAEGLEPSGESCAGSPAPVAERSEAQTLQAAGCRRSESRIDFGDAIY